MADVHADDNFPEHRRPPVTPDAHRRQSHDAAAESSSAGSSRSAAAPDLLTRERLLLHQSRLAAEQTYGPVRYDTTRRTKRRDRPSGSFLLDGGGVRRSHSSRLPKPTVAAPTARTGATTDSLSNTPESARSIALREQALRVASDPFAGKLLTPSPEATHNLSTGSLNQPSPASSLNSHAATSVDADSTQIVNMALNLSESRRLASRRNVSRAAPPKLLPLPDSATSNDLRQQLKQQRRSSRNISPRPALSMIPRQNTGLSVSSPLLSSFHMGQDDMYRYHFSASTLARAQKAKDQLELMAQYRRLLDVLPPLKPAHLRLVATSPPASPAGGAKAFAWTSNTVQLGRKYNPLQYIRNRKVRARERKIIDGERQGFGEVDIVKSWVERCEQNIALQQPEDEAEYMVPFSSADDPAAQSAPDPVAKAARNRRPRVDWFIEPCDMIADAYWLEQHQNKELIEDRHWRRIFPPNSELSRPMSRESEEPRHFMPFSPGTISRVPNLPEIHHTHRGHGAEHGRQPVIDRAREKLSHIKDSNHWHVSDHLYARPRSKKDSASEYSKSDNEARSQTIRDTRRRAETKDAHPGDILHKQMLEMIAKENRGKDVLDLAGIEHFVPSSMASPERNLRSKSSSRLQSRRESFLETSDQEHRGTFERMHKTSPSRFRSEDQVIDGPRLRAPRSIDNDSSLPTSPELRPSRKATLESVSLELPAPWSRSGSPSRHDAAKSHTNSEARLGADREAVAGSRADTLPRGTISYPPPLEGEPSLLRNSSAPVAGETIKSHRRMGSLLQRTDDPNSGLRGIFKGPRIDTVLRGGVSRIGDILRKKDGSGESQELESTDESDSEHNRGRRRASMSLSRRTSKKDQPKEQASKHFLDVMPQFQHASGSSADNSIHKSASWTAHGVQSSESSRVDLLKPPQAEVRSPSMSTSPPPNGASRPGESDVSEAESTKGRVPPGVRETDRRLNAILGDPVSRRFDRSERTKSRQWSIADQGARQIERSQLSRREMARVKTLVLSSGIKAMEISRRAQETHKPFKNDGANNNGRLANIDWDGIANLCPQSTGLHEQAVPLAEAYTLAAQTLTANVQLFGQRWQASADRFTTHTGPELHRRVGAVRSRIADDLAPLTRAAVEEADEASRGLALDQPLRIKHVVDTIEKMLRRRRRRLRWLRRGLWLSVEWLVVGFMWYVWFVVMILRVFLGIGKGLWGGVKWLLWLA
ncbi:hypothetical protein ISF_03315 [Cordyceps fumosorosea ARSEF 2679]|uniref:Uncharacterized protein n=1 Tax=Cordyceps fumosorosea (strain ARSEF 2679) TaxID=1081104 RepID=A0A168AME4_CORFA|nr:hypothetical protein ISF_03315 [Cordyceps fumosorosea ARSEF 2679]OAA68940.1 hypothetical protein ISF_03315 [Cordyceps fumosorosea ARSEF 2679]